MILVPRRTAKFVGRFEGFRSCPYRDAAGVWTIGFGTTGGVGPNTPCISKAKAYIWLRRDLRTAAKGVRRQIDRRLARNARIALISFTYNVGEGALASSTLRQRLNAGEPVCKVLPEELPRWVRAGGVKLPGLVRRRNAEARIACG